MGADVLLIGYSSVREGFLNFPSRKEVVTILLFLREYLFMVSGICNSKEGVLIRLQKRQVKQYDIKTPKTDLLPTVTNR
jgi:hypothetical protein